MKRNEKLPRVLVGTPIYEDKEYCRARFVANVRSFTYPNMSYMIVDNSKDDRYAKFLTKLYTKGHVAHVPRGENSRSALANSSNYLREKVLRGGYDYLLMLESDVFPPTDVIERLMAHGKSVAGACYIIGDGVHETPCLFRVRKTEMHGIGGTELLPPSEWENYRNKGLKPIHGMGVGCVLIHKSILERFPFWYSSADDARMASVKHRRHPDVYFYLDLHNNGIQAYVDTDIWCQHQYSKWSDVADV